MWSEARSHHRGPSSQASETAGCSGAAPAAAFRSGSRKMPAVKRPEATAPAGPMAFLPRHTACRRWVEPIQSLIRQLANPPERMAGRDPLLDRDVGEQGAAALLLASHQRMGSCSILAETPGFFSKLLTDGRRCNGQAGSDGKPVDETRYYFTSLRTSSKALLQHVRDRWSIENSWHWHPH